MPPLTGKALQAYNAAGRHEQCPLIAPGCRLSPAAGEMMARGYERHSDWELIQATASGSSEAFEVLVRRHDRLLRYLILRRRPSVLGFAEFHDIIDETWYQVLRRALGGDFNPSVRFSSWLGGMCLNVLKRKEFRPQGKSLVAVGADGEPALVEPTAVSESPDGAVERAELLVALTRCLAARPEIERRLYGLFYVEGRSKVDTAKALGCSEAYVRQKLLPRFHQALARCLARKGFRDVTL